MLAIKRGEILGMAFVHIHNKLLFSVLQAYFFYRSPFGDL